ncbi:aminoglycoside 6'-N-acetyltransferase [Clostridium gasigenes]|uniref:Aminoglycoside N(6')-acetyltransferase type 1 n=1 Tax=Clostridium gasigenes TaxID=94869 RepID=A0A7X0SC95_9CLOT|nr:aminoglycoside 6'-N-acetyltransferase [Clostridium gasigenes]MBB6715018.1 GNAT family N-acetyltransferase [Clostridium gasigenes]
MVREATKYDLDILAGLAILMWTNHTLENLKDEFADIMKKNNALFLLIFKDEQPIGFAQCQLRYDYVEGTESSPVGYLEGIFMRTEYRNKGYARTLLQECEKWSVSKGCKEFASDCELSNDTSLKFHLNMGFAEANRIICFTKKI